MLALCGKASAQDMHGFLTPHVLYQSCWWYIGMQGLAAKYKLNLLQKMSTACWDHKHSCVGLTSEHSHCHVISAFAHGHCCRDAAEPVDVCKLHKMYVHTFTVTIIMASLVLQVATDLPLPTPPPTLHNL